MKTLLLLAAGVVLVRFLDQLEREALDRRAKLPRPRPAFEVVRQGTGW